MAGWRDPVTPCTFLLIDCQYINDPVDERAVNSSCVQLQICVCFPALVYRPFKACKSIRFRVKYASVLVKKMGRSNQLCFFFFFFLKCCQSVKEGGVGKHQAGQSILIYWMSAHIQTCLEWLLQSPAQKECMALLFATSIMSMGRAAQAQYCAWSICLVRCLALPGCQFTIQYMLYRQHSLTSNDRSKAWFSLLGMA